MATRVPFRPVLAMATTAVLAAAPAPARAQGDEAEQAPHEEPAPPPARWAVGLNPLAVVIGRYGGDVQHLVAPGNALVLSVHVDYASQGSGPLDYSSSAPVWGIGGEAGWRFFPGAPGMRGMFLGASVLGALVCAEERALQRGATLAVFVPFSILYMREAPRLDYLWAGLCLLGAAYFIFRTR